MNEQVVSSIRAVDLPEIRAEMLQFITSRKGAVLYRFFMSKGLFPKRVIGQASPSELAVNEAGRLSGDLFYVSAPMTELATSASAKLPAFKLAPEDLPSRRGLIHFAMPIARILDSDRVPYYITGASWGPWADAGRLRGWTSGGIWVTWYAERSLMTGPASRWPTRFVADQSELVPFDHETFITSDGVTQVGENPYPIKILKSAWLLMQQPVARVEELAPDRASRKRIRRMLQEPVAVRVIQLRRAPSPGGAGESDREYHHQWIVRGHWRQQWYPGRQVHRPVWIAPHVKGPEGAPLIGGEKVHAWVR